MTAFGAIADDPWSLLMLALAAVILYLGIFKKYEPLLLVPIGFGVLLANIPGGDMNVVSADVIKDWSLVGIAKDHGLSLIHI